MTKSLPVLMYHYVSKCEGSISVDPRTFEDHCRTLAARGWHGISLHEAEQFLLNGTPLPRRSVLITFDDGYLDNYIYAWPVLKKYGHKAVIFAVTSKIENHATLRPTIDDIREGRARPDALPQVDKPFIEIAEGVAERQDTFFSWSEARAMEASGVITIAAHSHSHANIFCGHEYSGFIFPRGRGRTFYEVEGENLWGMPAYPKAPAFSGNAFLPSARLMDIVRSTVPQNKIEAYNFAQQQENRDRLQRRLDALSATEAGRYETDEERDARFTKDIAACKALLEKELGHARRSFCWPWGVAGTAAKLMAEQQGFNVFFTTAPGANPPHSAGAVHRFKVKNRSARWLLSRVRLYANPAAARIYSFLRR
ncbi:polysaccharide deacetylase family protein [Oleidesulfovibrio alaskensis]|jgi:peptidoglycan/xylan/chitin deacetylase (PgdA/CDA1 family)|uniref:polysaccharide deacetylase family protein n=1 Tax=Oleidesulfovibrio alaskensis TaxID=58180 RepID=UPI001A412F8F|nr:polysaccharide deacetylase family protein [Oleidesulfovibrio alaskensis]MBL3583269.1 polysaccharide deacetylase family protein [Oleidesulfovibrio alaskensis]